MKKSFVAVLIALLMTAMIAVSVFAIGGAALINKNSVAVLNSPAQGSDASLQASPQQTDQINQLQNLVSQYQDREKQYQQREQQLQDQLAQANAQLQQNQELIQQVRELLRALQQRGLITVTDDGRIFINH
jgi:TolA-binding protein